MTRRSYPSLGNIFISARLCRNTAKTCPSASLSFRLLRQSSGQAPGEILVSNRREKSFFLRCLTSIRDDKLLSKRCDTVASRRQGCEKLSTRIWIAYFFILSTALFTAGESAHAQQSSGAALKKVRIAIPSISASHMPAYMAKDLGYYADEGLDTEIILMRGGVSIQALVAGSVDYTGTPGATVAAAVQGVKLVVLMGYNNKSLYDLLVRPEISSYAELKGKRFGVGSLTGFSFEIPQIMLSRNGLDPKKDVTLF
jgi:hypothetical protein